MIDISELDQLMIITMHKMVKEYIRSLKLEYKGFIAQGDYEGARNCKLKIDYLENDIHDWE
jgi:mRNA-degrading endonuclease YafQ of YafQ-DinJ toxin-antitoxin module